VVNITSRSISYDFFLRAFPQEGSGSGFVYDDRGHIVTNFHVIEGASELHVTFFDETRVPAEVVGFDPSNDLAVIKVDVTPDLLRVIPLGDSERLRVGRFLVAIGNPFGLQQTLTTGVVSSLGRIIEGPDGRFIGEIIQTDAAINPGNSGGPLLDLDGKVVGVNSAIISPSGASAGIGFAITVGTVKRVVPELIARGRYAHPWLGVELWNVSANLAARLNRAGVRTPGGGGVMVVGLVARGPAATAGIRGPSQVGQLGNLRVPLGADYILAIDGDPVATDRDLTVLLETKHRVGDRVKVTVWREGQVLDIEAALGERPD
jgi:S1-C subfamily serine protease